GKEPGGPSITSKAAEEDNPAKASVDRVVNQIGVRFEPEPTGAHEGASEPYYDEDDNVVIPFDAAFYLQSPLGQSAIFAGSDESIMYQLFGSSILSFIKDQWIAAGRPGTLNDYANGIARQLLLSVPKSVINNKIELFPDFTDLDLFRHLIIDVGHMAQIGRFFGGYNPSTITPQLRQFARDFHNWLENHVGDTAPRYFIASMDSARAIADYKGGGQVTSMAAKQPTPQIPAPVQNMLANMGVKVRRRAGALHPHISVSSE